MRKAALFFCLSLALCACSGKKGDGKHAPQSQAKADNAKAQEPAKEAPSQRLSLRSFRPLLKEVMRAELDVDGLAIDFGSTDQHKYTRGGWDSGWADALGNDETTSFATTSGSASSIYMLLRETPRELVMRARTAGGNAATAKLDVLVGKTKIASGLAVTKDWKVVRTPIAEGALPPGRAQLKLAPSASIDIDWLWLPRAAEAGEYSNLPRSLPTSLGNGSRRSLAAPTPRSFSFYLDVPTGAKLLVDTGSNVQTKFQILAQTTSGTEELLSVLAADDRWQEQVVDLSHLAGQALRLEFRTEGDKGKTGWGEPEIMIPKLKIEEPATARAQNLVYVVMDTTRADSFDVVDSETVVKTPNYDKLARKSTTFRNAYNNENWTKPSITTMWSSLYPQTHGAREATSKVASDIRFLSEELKDAGFVTGAFIANAVVSETFGFNRGWTDFNNRSDHNTEGNGSRLYPSAAEWMEEHKDERFFVYVQSVDPHTTYDVPSDYWKNYYKGTYKGSLGSSFGREQQIVVDNGKLKVSADDLNWIKALYRGEVTYQDEYLGVLLNKIEELGLSESTLVVITNDHGEELKEHGGMGHGWPLYEEQIRAPLLMSFAPLFKVGANIKAIVEHVDLAPTILDALGLPPMKGAEGLSILPLLHDGIGNRQQPFYTVAWSRLGTRSVRVGDWKLTVGDKSDWMHLFNLKTDAKEMSNLLAGKEIPKSALLPARLCEIYLAETLATPDKAKRLEGAGAVRRHDSREIPIDDATRRELETLGYL